MLKGWTKLISFDIIIPENLIAKAQFRVWLCQKGIRLQEDFNGSHRTAIVASLERAERNPHVANAKDVARWLIPKNQITFQWRSTPR